MTDIDDDGEVNGDFTDPGFVTGAVLAQLEDLDRAAALAVIADVTSTVVGWPDATPDGYVAVTTSMSVTITVNLDTNTVVSTVVQTPDVASMADCLLDMAHYTDPSEPWQLRREATPAEVFAAVMILDNNNWPDPELVS